MNVSIVQRCTMEAAGIVFRLESPANNYLIQFAYNQYLISLLYRADKWSSSLNVCKLPRFVGVLKHSITLVTRQRVTLRLLPWWTGGGRGRGGGRWW